MKQRENCHKNVFRESLDHCLIIWWISNLIISDGKRNSFLFPYKWNQFWKTRADSQHSFTQNRLIIQLLTYLPFHTSINRVSKNMFYWNVVALLTCLRYFHYFTIFIYVTIAWIKIWFSLTILPSSYQLHCLYHRAILLFA